jgi:hypothetical protein
MQTRRSFVEGLVALLFISGIVFAAKKRDWKEGTLVSVETMTIPAVGRNVDHRYLCTVSDGALLYTVEYEKPLKVAINDSVKFAIEGEWLTLIDADGKERSAKIEKRERKTK